MAELHPYDQDWQISDPYDGTNGTALAALFDVVAVDSDDGTTLELSHSFIGPMSLVHGDALYGTGASLGGYMPGASVPLSFRPRAGMVSATGTASVPASLLGQTADYDVTLSQGMGGTEYAPIASLRGAAGIVSGHSITAVAVLSATQVRVTVSSAAASLAGATIHVLALAAS